MDKEAFTAPVTVYLTDSKQFSIVSGLSDASDFLFDHWAGNDSAEWMFAMNKCNAAMAGKTSSDEVRTAFIAAARGAGMQLNCEISLP